MTTPELGIALHTITTDLSPEGLRLLDGTAVRMLELKQSLFAGEEGENCKAILRDCLSQLGITAPTIHAQFGTEYDLSSPDPRIREQALQSVFAAIDLAAFFGSQIVVVHASAEPIQDSTRQGRITHVREGLAKIGERSRKARKKIAVELLPRTCIGNTLEELLDLIAPFEDGSMGVCLDTNHFMSNPGALPHAVRVLGCRLLTLHLSDYDGVDEKHWLPGRGVIDWSAFMKALRDIHYDGPFIYECSFRPSERLQMICENYSWLAAQ